MNKNVIYHSKEHLSFCKITCSFCLYLFPLSSYCLGHLYGYFCIVGYFRPRVRMDMYTFIIVFDEISPKFLKFSSISGLGLEWICIHSLLCLMKFRNLFKQYRNHTLLENNRIQRIFYNFSTKLGKQRLVSKYRVCYRQKAREISGKFQGNFIKHNNECIHIHPNPRSEIYENFRNFKEILGKFHQTQ